VISTRTFSPASYAEAQKRLPLGRYYALGQGVPQDYVQARLWFSLAASRMTGNIRETAVRFRDGIADVMTPDDLSEAQRLAREGDAGHLR